jgi:hypothetical protein
MPTGRIRYGDENRPINTQPHLELPNLQELSLEELAELPDQTRHLILMRAATEFEKEREEDAKKRG